MSAKEIFISVGDDAMNTHDPVLAQSMLLHLFPALQSVAVAAAPANDSAPKLGAYWPGQGGIYGGDMPARDGEPAYSLIFAAKDIGDHKWGGYNEQSKATSKRDGLANTQALLAEGGHPAAEAASKYTADGHADFYLPAAAELYQAWVDAPELFDTSTYYWSSSQRSAYGAFLMLFGGGTQVHYGKHDALRVRPVRRFIR